MYKRQQFISLVLVGLVTLAANFAWAQDPMEVGPDIYKLKFENERVRVMDITFAPGAKIAMHHHPDHMAIIISGGTLNLSYPDGTTKELSGNRGDTFWIPAETHAAENIGTTEVTGIVIELKEPVREVVAKTENPS